MSVGGIVVSIAAFQAVDPGSIPGRRSRFVRSWLALDNWRRLRFFELSQSPQTTSFPQKLKAVKRPIITVGPEALQRAHGDAIYKRRSQVASAMLQLKKSSREKFPESDTPGLTRASKQRLTWRVILAVSKEESAR